MKIEHTPPVNVRYSGYPLHRKYYVVLNRSQLSTTVLIAFKNRIIINIQQTQLLS